MESHDKVFFSNPNKNHCTQANKFLLFNVYLKIYLHTEKKSFGFVKLSWNVWYSSFFGIWFAYHHLYWAIHTHKIYLFKGNTAANSNSDNEKMKFIKKSEMRIVENRSFIGGENKI